jgi:hypothetical protein
MYPDAEKISEETQLQAQKGVFVKKGIKWVPTTPRGGGEEPKGGEADTELEEEEVDGTCEGKRRKTDEGKPMDSEEGDGTGEGTTEGTGTGESTADV